VEFGHRGRFGAATVGILLVALTATAHATVQVRLTAHRIMKDAKGAETFQVAEQIKPGETVEYRAVYHNEGEAGVEKLIATLPIPAGTEFVAGTASPAGALASLDGKTYSAMPLKRKVRLSDGREVERDVPAAEYRFLRWTLGSLGSRKESTVRTRVRVTALSAGDASGR
jgi:uncharacterized repeat protein (TIGR01451 family)